MKLSISGLRELDASLGELSKSTARNTLRRVLMKAGQPIADEAARLAPDDPLTGAPDLKTSIAVSAKIRNKVGQAEFAQAMRSGQGKAAAVAAMREARRNNPDSFAEVYVGPSQGGEHAVPQEFGTIHHGPQPFMRPAWDSKKQEALDVIRGELAGEIGKSVARARRRAAKKAAM